MSSLLALSWFACSGGDVSPATAWEDDTLSTGTDATAVDTGDTAAPMDTGQSDSGPPPDTEPPEREPVDYRVTGPFAVALGSRSVTSSGGCTMTVGTHQPQGVADAPVVVLAHGFSRTPAQVAGWAAHLASWGLRAVTPALCHLNILETQHEANGRDLADLASQLGGSAVFVGHSAGGLASLLAASQDPSALAVIGLDLTDTEGLAETAASSLAVPYYGLVGESSDCNSQNNGIAVARAAPDAWALRITEADHCDFEDETDWLCTTFCPGTNDQFQDTDIQDTIRGLLTGAAMDAAGLDSAAQDWWVDGGAFRTQLDATGRVSDLGG